MSHLTLVPAYGNDYKSKAEVRAALLNNVDFYVSSGLRCGYAALTDMENSQVAEINVRYGKLRKVAVFSLAELRKARHDAIEAAKAANDASEA